MVGFIQIYSIVFKLSRTAKSDLEKGSIAEAGQRGVPYVFRTTKGKEGRKAWPALRFMIGHLSCWYWVGGGDRPTR